MAMTTQEMRFIWGGMDHRIKKRWSSLDTGMKSCLMALAVELDSAIAPYSAEKWAFATVILCDQNTDAVRQVVEYGYKAQLTKRRSQDDHHSDLFSFLQSKGRERLAASNNLDVEFVLLLEGLLCDS